MEPRSLLVTGATGVLGAEIVRATVQQGFQVSALFHRNEERARKLQNETGCRIYGADVADEAQIEALFEELPKLYGIVHAAGVAFDALLVRQSVEQWRETLRVNSEGAFLITRAALRALPEGGRLILLSSRVGERGNAGQTAYAAGKAAVTALARCAAREGGPRGITVNVLYPGFVPSVMSEGLSVERLEEYRRQSVLNTYGTPQSVAAAVLWLLSEGAAEVSGQIIHCHSRI